MATGSTMPVAILRDGRPSKSAVADFDTLTLPKSGKPDFGGRPPQDEGFQFLHTLGELRSQFPHDATILARCIRSRTLDNGAMDMNADPRATKWTRREALPLFGPGAASAALTRPPSPAH